MSPEANAQWLRSCNAFRPAPVQTRSCGLCGHSWVLHALEKLGPRRASGCGPVEVAVPGLVLDLSALVLYGAQAVPVRLKILLDRLYSVLTPDQVGHILHTLGWSLGDYVRGYQLQDVRGHPLDRWLMVNPQEEQLILKQFLRFGETRPIVQLMTGSALMDDDSRKHQSMFPLTPYGTPSTKDLVSPFDATAQQSTKPCESPRALAVKPDPDSPPSTEPVSPPDALGSFGFSASFKPALTSVSSAFLCPPLALGGSLLTLMHSGTAVTGRKGRVCCGVCGKSFYDKGTLKIHYNAVHLKIKHRCTVTGCTMVFSSLRSRNRHSANPNPRLHTCAGPHSVPHPGNPNLCLHTCPGPPKNHELISKLIPNAMEKRRDEGHDVCPEAPTVDACPGAPISDVCHNVDPEPFHKTIPNTADKQRNSEQWGQFQRDTPILINPAHSPDGSFLEDSVRSDSFMVERCCSKRRDQHNAAECQQEVTPKKKSRKSSIPVKIERHRLGEM